MANNFLLSPELLTWAHLSSLPYVCGKSLGKRSAFKGFVLATPLGLSLYSGHLSYGDTRTGHHLHLSLKPGDQNNIPNAARGTADIETSLP